MKHRIAAGFLALLTCAALAAQRLPRVVFPERYDLTITPDLAAETFSGEETIAIKVEQAVKSIEINASDIFFGRATVTSGRDTQTATVTLNEDNERATLNLQRPIDVGSATIQISYRGKLNRQLRGFYIGEANGKKYVASQMEAVDARHAFPSFDEPEFKAQFSITVIIDEKLKAFSNGAVESETAGPAGKRSVRFALTPRMSTYLVALVIGDFDCLGETVEGVPSRICVAPDRVEFGRLALEENNKVLRFLNRYYSTHYPFAKLDHIGVADFAAGAMENAGAILYRDRYLVTDPKIASPEQRKLTSTIIAHEVAHQWFGDLVTMKWWDDIWLNEGFASWMETKAVKEIHPEWNMAMDALEATNDPLRTDVLSTTRAIHHPVETRAEIEQVFDAIAYTKTAAVLRMLEQYAGPEKFRDGINYYIGRNAWGNASAGDFAAALSLMSDETTGEVLQSYVKQPGVPLITIDSRCDGDTTVIDLRQERFFVRRDRLAAASDQIWTIPVCVRQGNERECLVIRERSKTFRLPGCQPPLFVNAGGEGYYLTAYGQDDRNALLATTKGMSPAERFVFMRDEWFLTRSGLRSAGDYLDLAERYSNETERATIKELLTNLAVLERYVVSDAQRPQFQAWLQRFLAPLSRRLGWKEGERDSDDIRNLRSTLILVLGHSAADPATRRQARQVAQQFLKDPASVSPAIAPAALQVAAIDGDARLYDAYLAAYRAAKNPNVKSQLRDALASFHDPKLLRRTLDLALSDEVRSQDAGILLGAVIRNRAGTDLGWNYLKEKWEAIYKKLPWGSAGFMIGSTAAMCDLAGRDEVRELMKKHNVREATRSTASAAERITACVEFRDLQRQNLSSWIEQRAR